MAGKGPERKAADALITAANQFTFNPALFSGSLSNELMPGARLNVMRGFLCHIQNEARRYDMGDESPSAMFAKTVLDHIEKFDDYKGWML